MLKKFPVIFISLIISIALMGCNDVEEDLLSENFSVDPFFTVTEGEPCLSDEEIKSVFSNIPSDKYETYPNTHSIPLSATLYKNGEIISIDVSDERLIRLTNFFNNCVCYSKCAYTQGLLSLDDIEKEVTGADFRLELKYTPYGDGPSAYGTCTTGSDMIVVTNSYSGFVLMAHDLPGYEGEEEMYPFRAVGFSPLYFTYNWLDLFGF